MNFGELDAGLNALDVVKISRANDGTPTALIVDGAPLEIGSGGPAGPVGPAAVADTYATNARFFEFDIHYQMSKFGTIPEFPT